MFDETLDHSQCVTHAQWKFAERAQRHTRRDMKGVVADESAVKLPPLRYSENCAPKSYLAGMCEDD